MLFGVNEMASRSSFEVIFSTMVMLVSAMVSALIFSQMAVLIQDMNKKTNKFQDQSDTANSAVKSLILPNRISKNVQEYLLNTQYTQDQ